MRDAETGQAKSEISYTDGFIWEDQNVDNVQSFFSEFEQRIKDCNWQNWNDSISNMPKLRTYSLFKSSLQPELYLTLSIPYKIRKALAKFRVSNNDLEIERGRHTSLEVHQRLCKLCLSVNVNCIEDEFHVLMACPFYQDLRNVYLNC